MEYKVLWSSKFYVKSIEKKTKSDSVENTITTEQFTEQFKEKKYDQKNERKI